MMKYIGTAITVILIVIVAIIYYGLMTARNKAKQAYFTMDVCLKKRWDFIPRLVEVVKEYSVFDDLALKKLISLRVGTFDNLKMEQKLDVDIKMSKVVLKMLEMAEISPDLKASEEYVKLRKEFFVLENDITNSIKNYNTVAKKYNEKIKAVPNNVVAILFGFDEQKVFEHDEKS